ncbi:Ras GTPase-activating protein [Planoprotostelium fungivorum]|uniref:Ras GTPase-activating protein n=1 Tax=Planoprotostelium fungivorum TaxID=1890364 RepID=A0A2P6NEJ8_9EUKA|nr:Ras GTPase-activating protein [Planoprotostelium fungivorum]
MRLFANPSLPLGLEPFRDKIETMMSRNRDDTINSYRYSISTLFRIVHDQDAEKGDALEVRKKELGEVKKEIALGSKRNFNIEKDVSILDQKIALLIKNRITLEEVMASSGDINTLLLQRTTTIKDKKEREYYGQLFYLLFRETSYVATLARLVKLGEIDNLLQTVMFTLYGNQYDEQEEHLLLSLFQKVLQEEIAEATSINTLMRANTALTRMMTTYTRRGPGQTYLKNTLTGSLNKILSNPDLSLEINPAKVYEAYILDYETRTGQTCPLPKKVDPDQAAATPEIRAIVDARVVQLDQLAHQFITALIASTSTVPYGIRWICKQIRALARAKFPKSEREQIVSLIGGFYLLRFVNPAVVTPQAFMIVDTKLSANSRRNLTLLAKILQNLANNTQMGGLKEAYMAPLNNFLTKIRPKFNEFLEELTKVDDLDDHLHMDRYLRMAKVGDTSIHITFNEMYSLHALLLEHQDILSKKGGDNSLKIILAELGPAPAQIARKDNSNVDLLLLPPRGNSRESIDNRESKPQQTYSETKSLLFYIIKSLPRLENNNEIAEINVVLDMAEAQANSTKDGKLMDRIKKVRNNCKLLVQCGLLSESDKFNKIRKDLVEEIVNYEAQIRKTTEDIIKLKNVRKTIDDHHKFLTQQYDTYKQYLNNVRENTTGPSKSTKSASSKSDKKKTAVVKFSHVKLQQDGVIIESEVPEERRNNIFFQFQSLGQGNFTVTVLYKSRAISEMSMVLDDLLEKQHNNHFELEIEFIKLNVNLLVFLINKHFNS